MATYVESEKKFTLLFFMVVSLIYMLDFRAVGRLRWRKWKEEKEGLRTGST